jgi:hypothetical protein
MPPSDNGGTGGGVQLPRGLFAKRSKHLESIRVMELDVELKVRGLLRYVEINMHDSKLALGTGVGSMRDRGTEAIPGQWQYFPRQYGDWRLHVFEAASSQTQAQTYAYI